MFIRARKCFDDQFARTRHARESFLQREPLPHLIRQTVPGTPIREQVFEGNPCFLLTDHIPMPKNTFHTLDRLGTKKISLGRTMLFASQCVVLIHHELDQRRLG